MWLFPAFGEFSHFIIVLFFCKEEFSLSPSENIIKHTLIFFKCDRIKLLLLFFNLDKFQTPFEIVRDIVDVWKTIKNQTTKLMLCVVSSFWYLYFLEPLLRSLIPLGEVVWGYTFFPN